jgi:hypothetical protein
MRRDLFTQKYMKEYSQLTPTEIVVTVRRMRACKHPKKMICELLNLTGADYEAIIHPRFCFVEATQVAKLVFK